MIFCIKKMLDKDVINIKLLERYEKEIPKEEWINLKICKTIFTNANTFQKESKEKPKKKKINKKEAIKKAIL